jgi:hypothetical protein
MFWGDRRPQVNDAVHFPKVQRGIARHGAHDVVEGCCKRAGGDGPRGRQQPGRGWLALAWFQRWLVGQLGRLVGQLRGQLGLQRGKLGASLAPQALAASLAELGQQRWVVGFLGRLMGQFGRVVGQLRRQLGF